MSKPLDLNKRIQSLNAEWSFSYEPYNSFSAYLGKADSKMVNIPHDYMLETEVIPEAPAAAAMGYYTGKTAYYTKKILIPEEWKDEQVLLHFDGVMLNATVGINGSFVALHHYGYTPFDADITPYIYWGEENRICVTVNPSMQPNSRWYTGAGIYRPVTLVHRPLLHIVTDGIYTYTKRVEYTGDQPLEAFITSEVTIENNTLKDRLAKVTVTLTPETFTGESISRSTVIMVKAQKTAKAMVPITVKNPVLWEEDHPELYTVSAVAEDQGTFGVALNPAEGTPMTDKEAVLFGIRTLTADSTHGLQINGRTVKLKGGCIHHDNGILGAVSLYDSEYRKLKKHKELGYNAIRIAHNPPSAAMLEACDRLGLYVMNEAFDAWGMGKQPGDYNQYFADHWKEDIKAFMLRDRNHPSVILWSTGNEIEERGGLGNGYALAAELADYMRSIDSTRLITNGLCSYWSGLDDKKIQEFAKRFAERLSDNPDIILQNASTDSTDTYWEERSEAFVSSLDVVGYNYMDDHYEIDGNLYLERVIVGTESYPNVMDTLWAQVEKLPNVIGDFTWTSYDYLGEAGIGKTAFVEEGDPLLKMGALALRSQSSQFPWRLANDADMDINGGLLAQGAMRKILWGSKETFLYSADPVHFGKIELVSTWGWTDVSANWSWPGFEGKSTSVVIYSPADTVELFLNGESLGTKPAGRDNHFQTSFIIAYQPGILEAVSYENGNEISRTCLQTPGAPAAIRLVPEKAVLTADGNSLCYVAAEIIDADGISVNNAAFPLTAEVSGAGSLAGFGSANPITAENYTAGSFTTYRGRVMAVVRAGHETGKVVLTIRSETLGEVSVTLDVQ